MFEGISSKRKKALETYKDDKEYPEQTEVERRFNITMETIENRLGMQIRSQPVDGPCSIVCSPLCMTINLGWVRHWKR